jgi:hypothetical protein
MPSERYTRIEIMPEAYRGLEAEAILQGKTLKKLASEIILQGISQKARMFTGLEEIGAKDKAPGNNHPLPGNSHIQKQGQGAEPPKIRRQPLSENQEAIGQIKYLWTLNPRPSQRKIAKQIGYPPSSTKYFIKKMLEVGELEA